MAALLSLEQCSEYVTALAQLVEEFDFHYSNSAVQFMVPALIRSVLFFCTDSVAAEEDAVEDAIR